MKVPQGLRETISVGEIELRRYCIEYAPMLFSAASESKGGEFSRWLPWCHSQYSLADAESFVNHSIESWKSGLEYNFAILESSGQRFLGGIGLSQGNLINGSFNLGYWVRVSQQNLGIASRAARALAQAAFEDLTVNRIEIVAAAENRPSRTAAEKAGARFEGILRKKLVIGETVHDGAMYSFTAENFAL